MAVLLGRTTGGTSADWSAPSVGAAWEFTALASGDVATIHFTTKVANPGASQVQLAIYADAGAAPGARLGIATVSGTITGTGTMVATLSSPVAVVAGTQYWLAFMATGENFDFQGDGSGFYSADFAGLPETWGQDAAGAVNAIIWGEGSGGTPPANTVAPAVTGTPQVGETLTCSTGTWTGDPTPTFTRQWQRDNEGGGSYTNISGATSSTYTLVEDDLDCRVRCVVTGTNLGGNSSANSNAAGPVEEAPPLEFSIRLSGGGSNTNPQASFGGAKSSASVSLSPAQMGLDTGDPDTRAARYWCLYIENEDDVDFTIEAWFAAQPTGQTWQIAAGAAASGATETATANNGTAPSGRSFSSPSTEGGALSLGQADSGEAKSFWIHRPPAPGATAGDRTVDLRLKLTEVV